MDGQVKPSEIVLVFLPLTGTMGRAEIEWAAALVVRTCQVLGDKWQEVIPRQIGLVLQEDVQAKREPWASLETNPFFHPDFPDLGATQFAKIGFKEVEELPSGGSQTIELTDVGISAIASKWQLGKGEFVMGKLNG